VRWQGCTSNKDSSGTAVGKGKGKITGASEGGPAKKEAIGAGAPDKKGVL